ncbi:hypothetical protein NUSPORA_01474 [Nucleospora cyclopteri]
MVNLISELFFYMESMDHEGFMLGFKSNGESVLTKDRNLITNVKLGKYYTGYSRIDVNGSDKEGIEVGGNKMIKKVKRGRTWAQSFGLSEFNTASKKGFIRISQGPKDCVSGPAIDQQIKLLNCKQPGGNFKVVFTKDAPIYITPKSDQHYAMYIPEEGGNVEMRDLKEGTKLRVNLSNVKAPIATAKDHTMVLTATDFNKLTASPLEFITWKYEQIFQVEPKDGGIKIMVKNSAGKKHCLSFQGPYKTLLVKPCLNSDKSQLFEELKEEDYSNLLNRSDSPTMFKVKSNHYELSLGVSAEKAGAKVVATELENGKGWQYTSNLKALFLGSSNLSLTNEKLVAVLKQHTGSENQKFNIEPSKNKTSGIFIKTANGKDCLTFDGFEEVPLIFEPCDDNNKRQIFQKDMVDQKLITALQKKIPSNGGNFSAAIAAALEKAKLGLGEETKVKIFIYSANRSVGLSTSHKENSLIVTSPARDGLPFSYDPVNSLLYETYNSNLVVAHKFRHTSEAILQQVNGSEDQKIFFEPENSNYFIKNRNMCLARLGLNVIRFVECTGGQEMKWKIDVLGDSEAPHVTPFFNPSEALTGL